MLILSLTSPTQTKEVQFPTEWTELSAAQLQAYCNFIYPYRGQVFEVIENKLYIKEGREEQYFEMANAMLFSLLNLPMEEYLQFDGEAFRQLIYDEKVLRFLFLEYDLWINPITQIHAPGREPIFYFGPTTGFAQLTLSEFLDADEAYRNYLELRNSDTAVIEPVEMVEVRNALVQLVSILYREQQKNYDPRSPDTNGDCREKYNDLTVQYRTEDISRVDPSLLLSIFIWFESAKNIVTQKYQVCFKGAAGQASDIDPILTISRSMLNYEMFKAAPAMLVLEDVKKQILEAEELKSKSKQQ